MFTTYLELGIRHIMDWQAYDHMLYLLALIGVYRFSDWRRVLWLITAFTLGHCLTLVIAGLELIQVDSRLVEMAIPVTIFITAVANIWNGNRSRQSSWDYVLTLFFGLIHGLGFSNQFRSLLGREEHIVELLIPFNLGVELGQIAIVALILIIGHFAQEILTIKSKIWIIGISSIAALLSIYLFVQIISTT